MDELSHELQSLEILIVVSIISIASSAFILLFNQPTNNLTLQDKISFYKTLSAYSGSTYKFNNNGIYEITGEGRFLIEDLPNFSVNYALDLNGFLTEVNNEDFYLTIFPGLEVSTRKIVLDNGTEIVLVK